MPQELTPETMKGKYFTLISTTCHTGNRIPGSVIDAVGISNMQRWPKMTTELLFSSGIGYAAVLRPEVNPELPAFFQIAGIEIEPHLAITRLLVQIYETALHLYSTSNEDLTPEGQALRQFLTNHIDHESTDLDESK